MEAVNNKIPETQKSKSGLPKKLRWPLIGLACIVGIGMLILLSGLLGSKEKPSSNAGVFEVNRGDLTISVTEGGDIKALNSVDIKCGVEGGTTIISIVDEGTIIKPEDVANGKVLVELDSSKIKEKLTSQQITFLKAQASYTEAKEALEIQKKENDSNIQAGEMKLKFALMDFKKYLGETVADAVLERAKQSGGSGTIVPMEDYVENPQLGGLALQELRKLRDEITVADGKLTRAEDKLIGTKKLFDHNYVAKIEVKGDELDVNSLKIQKAQAETALKLFKLYEFTKNSEELLSKFYEAERDLDRIKASTRSKLAQAQAKLGSEEASYLLQREELGKLNKQMTACVIKAPTPGQVVYSSSTDNWARQNRPIEIGGAVRELQKIISIPDPTIMKAEIKVHETWVDKIEIGQKAKIKIAAFPDMEFTGKVIRKAPLADPEHWSNPDLKVYTTDVCIDGTHKFLKTGMTAEIEVIVKELKDVISVPIQAVVSKESKKMCYVLTEGGLHEEREVATGLFNDNFVEIKKGLSEGEMVLLNPPRPNQQKAK